MDMRQLKYFLAVAHEGQITRAARLLHMEQPPLSRQMKQMEEELSVRLFDRDRMRFKLTEAGEVLGRRRNYCCCNLMKRSRRLKKSRRV